MGKIITRKSIWSKRTFFDQEYINYNEHDVRVDYNNRLEEIEKYLGATINYNKDLTPHEGKYYNRGNKKWKLIMKTEIP